MSDDLYDADEFRQTLRAMRDELASAGSVFVPSRFWDWLNERNIDQLTRTGIENFKRTANQNYYNWIPSGYEDNQFRRLLEYWSRHPGPIPFQLRLEQPELLEGFFEKNPFSDPDYSEYYKFFVGMLWQFAIEHDPQGIAQRLAEPEIGNPIRTRWQGKLVSQDLANSLRERNTIMELARTIRDRPPVVAELGAGYGRLAYAFAAGGSCRYLIFDIPPALTVAQWYLQQVFPEKRIFAFRPFASFDDVAEEVAGADIALFTANQLDLLPDEYVDIFASISSLHEMTHGQIDHYKAAIARATSSAVYFKQWKSWENHADNITVTSENYLLPKPWRLILDRQDAIQDMFQEQGFTKVDQAG